MLCNAKPNVVRVVLRAYPGAVDEIDAWGHRPVHYGLSHHSSLQVSRELLAADGHHADDSMRRVVMRVKEKEAGGGGGGSGSGDAEGGETWSPPTSPSLYPQKNGGSGGRQHHEGQYWNKPWNYQEVIMAKKRWGKERVAKKKIDPKDGGNPAVEEEGEEEVETSDSDSSSDSDSDGSDDSDDDSDSDDSDSDDSDDEDGDSDGD